MYEEDWDDPPAAALPPQGRSFGGKGRGFKHPDGDDDGRTRGGVGSDVGKSNGKGDAIDWDNLTRDRKNRSGSDVKGGKKGVPYVPPDAPNVEDDLFSDGIRTGVNFRNYDLIDVKATGENVPRKIESFDEAGLCPLIMSNIRRNKYEKPTPVQKSTIPILLAGRDVMACAQTGSGKTASFLIPFIHMMLEEGESDECFDEGMCMPRLLVVAPTRELATQTYVEAKKFAYGSRLGVERVYGGTSYGHQKSRLTSDCDILVATPGRLLHFMEDQISLRRMRYFVIDEADLMLKDNFLVDIERLLRNATVDKEGLQSVMFSATFPPKVQESASSLLRDYIFVTVGIVGGACEDVEQKFIEVEQRSKRTKLVELLEEHGKGRTLVFVRNQRTADIIATYLSEKDIPSTSMHGGRDQKLREEALSDFKSGRMGVLVATAVAARGLNIKNVAHVINFDLPDTIDEYVHRIGRTGRVGNKGKATSFYCGKTDASLASGLIWILKHVRQEVPEFLAEAAYNNGGEGGSATSMFGGRDVRSSRRPSSNLEPAQTYVDEVW